MKILFITDFILAEEQGAKQSSIAHYNTLKEIFNEENVDVVSLNSTYDTKNGHIIFWERKRNKVQKLKSIFQRIPFLLSKNGENKIIELCIKNHYTCVFVDHSIYGSLIKKIKKEISIPIITYFHGIMQYQNLEYKKNNKVSMFYFLPCMNIIKNEIETVKFSDKCLVLNERDNKNFKYYYKKNADGYLPVYYTDNAKIEMIDAEDNFKILFVGGYFWPNIHGIKWFVDNVMTELPNNVFLDIVGNNMEKLKGILECQRVKVIGRVDCLDEFYNNADVVVGPIFEGEGMKTKTCEALMYGKLYLGTNEALEGYIGLDHLRCNTKEEFISMITKIKKSHCPKFHDEMRKIYEDNYSPQMAYDRLTDIFVELGVLDRTL